MYYILDSHTNTFLSRSVINRSFAWIDESIEHSDSDYARASALAKKWSALETEREDRYFRRQYDYENGNDWDPFEYCECEFCLVNNHRCSEEVKTELTECEARKAYNAKQAEKQAEHDLELELVEDKLSLLGARMMRPYEHWNEDERYMEYMETRYDY